MIKTNHKSKRNNKSLLRIHSCNSSQSHQKDLEINNYFSIARKTQHRHLHNQTTQQF